MISVPLALSLRAAVKATCAHPAADARGCPEGTLFATRCTLNHLAIVFARVGRRVGIIEAWRLRW